jgi:hypothetical protein
VVETSDTDNWDRLISSLANLAYPSSLLRSALLVTSHSAKLWQHAISHGLRGGRHQLIRRVDLPRERQPAFSATAALSFDVEWVLWLDAGVQEVPPSLIGDLLAVATERGADIVAASCLDKTTRCALRSLY